MKLPVELLEEIHILPETRALAHVCRSSYIALSSEFARLRFCTRLFYLDNSRKDPDQEGVRLRDEQSKILAQEWFTVDFATKVKAAVKHIRVEDYTQLSLCFRGYISPLAYCVGLGVKANSSHLNIFSSGGLKQSLVIGPDVIKAWWMPSQLLKTSGKRRGFLIVGP